MTLLVAKTATEQYRPNANQTFQKKESNECMAGLKLVFKTKQLYQSLSTSENFGSLKLGSNWAITSNRKPKKR